MAPPVGGGVEASVNEVTLPAQTVLLENTACGEAFTITGSITVLVHPNGVVTVNATEYVPLVGKDTEGF
jgi:hypothetical protein